ncbi:hypothetical protein D3C72_1212830 [compost metagenome]
MDQVNPVGTAADPRHQVLEHAARPQVIAVVGSDPDQHGAQHRDHTNPVMTEGKAIRCHEAEQQRHRDQCGDTRPWTTQECGLPAQVRRLRTPHRQQHAKGQRVGAHHHQDRRAQGEQLHRNQRQQKPHKVFAKQHDHQREQQVELLFQRQAPVHETGAVLVAIKTVGKAEIGVLRDAGQGRLKVRVQGAEGA